ncbi:MAG: TetR family transcriptional regulator [Cetobacterium sp.]
MFSKEVFEKVSTKYITQEINCNKVTIFRLFGTKDNLLEKIINKFV